MQRYCLALDLKNDEAFIAGYEKHHIQAWPVILKSISNSGIFNMEIYREANGLRLMSLDIRTNLCGIFLQC